MVTFFNTYGTLGTTERGPRGAALKDLEACRKEVLKNLEARRQRTSRGAAVDEALCKYAFSGVEKHCPPPEI